MKKAPKNGMIYLVPHSHYDAIWVFTKEEYFYINIDLILRKATEFLTKYKDFKFMIEQIYLLEEVERRYPDLFEKIGNYIKEGRIEIADGEYLMSDTMLPNGETLVREILYGKQYVKEKFGVEVPVMWQADSFGLNAQLPQIYRKSKYKYIAFRRGCAKNNPTEFLWEGLDGTRIISYFLPLGYRAGMDLEKLDESYETLRKLSSTPCILMPSGSGGLVPQNGTMKAVKTWNKNHDIKMKVATPYEYFKDLEKYADKFTVRRGEMFCGKYSRVFPDVASSRIWLKKSLRDYENKLLSFEKFASINFILEKKYYPGVLRNCWEKVMFLGFHDVAPGTGMDSGYEEAKQHIGFLRTQLECSTPTTLKSLLQNDTDKKINADIAVFNPLSWDVTNWVEVDLDFDPGKIRNIRCLKNGDDEIDIAVLHYSKYKDGSFEKATIGFFAHVPATGYKVYKILGKKQESHTLRSLKISGNVVENKFFRLHFDFSNGLIEVFKDGKRVCGGNEMVVEAETGDLYYHKEPLGIPLRTESGEGVTFGSFKAENFWIDKFPLRVVINITTDYYSLRWPYKLTDRLKPLIWKHRFIRFKKEIIIYRDIPRIDFVTRVDNMHPRMRLRVRFDTDINKKEYTCESQFGAVKRKTNQHYFKPHDWVEQPSGVSPSLNWIDYGDEENGITIINKGTPENEVRDGNIYITLLRAVDILSSDGVAGPAIPVTDASEIKKFDFNYSLYLHKGSWKEAKSYKHGHEFNSDLIAIQISNKEVYRAENSFLRADPDNIIVCAIKKAENDDGIIVRFYETIGQKTEASLTLFRTPEEVKVVNLLEEEDEEFNKEVKIRKNKIKLNVKPFEIVTLKVKF
jgi:alpha-mannosidase